MSDKSVITIEVVDDQLKESVKLWETFKKQAEKGVSVKKSGIFSMFSGIAEILKKTIVNLKKPLVVVGKVVSGIKSVFKSIAVFGAIGIGMAYAIKKVFDKFSDIGQAVFQRMRFGQSAGISTKGVANLENVAKYLGDSAEDAHKIAQGLQKSRQVGTEQYTNLARLGISPEAVKGYGTQELIETIARQAKAMSGGSLTSPMTKHVLDELESLGFSSNTAADMILNGSKNITAAFLEVGNKAITMSDAQARAAHQQSVKLGIAWDNIMMKLTTKILPYITLLQQHFQKLLESGSFDKFIDLLGRMSVSGLTLLAEIDWGEIAANLLDVVRKFTAAIVLMTNSIISFSAKWLGVGWAKSIQQSPGYQSAVANAESVFKEKEDITKNTMRDISTVKDILGIPDSPKRNMSPIRIENTIKIENPYSTTPVSQVTLNQRMSQGFSPIS